MSGSGSSIPEGGGVPQNPRVSREEKEPSHTKFTLKKIKEKGSIIYDEEMAPENVKLYVCYPGGHLPIKKKLSPELNQAREDARTAAIAYIREHYGPEWQLKNLNFKYSTGEVYINDPSSPVSKNVELPKKLRENILKMFDEELSEFISTEDWHEMAPDQLSFTGTGTRVIGNLEVFLGKFSKVLKRLEGKKTSQELEKTILGHLRDAFQAKEKPALEGINLPKGKLEFDTDGKTDERIARISRICNRAITELRAKIEKKRADFEGLQQQINDKNTPSNKRDNLNTNANALNTEIEELEAKVKAYEELQNNQFALKWALAFRSSSLAQSPFFNAQYSYLLLNKFIHERVALACNEEEINDYCVEVSRLSFLKPEDRGQLVEFLRKHNADLKETSLDERVLNALVNGDDKKTEDIVSELLASPEKSKTPSSPSGTPPNDLRVKMEPQDIEHKDTEGPPTKPPA